MFVNRCDKGYGKITETPQGFYEKYVQRGVDVAQMVSLVNDPRHEYNKKMTVDCLGNVVGKSILYLNVPVDYMIELAAERVKAGEPVWFGCDVGKSFDRATGQLTLDLYAHDEAFGSAYRRMNKAERLLYRESMMTHAMVFTGVHYEDGKPGELLLSRDSPLQSGELMG